MTIQLSWPEIALRLILTVAAAGLIGINREEHGHPAGLRTTILVCLAASLSMIQVNLLLGMNGKSPSSFVVMDLMRLPLGILTGVGFIGAGAILRKDTLVMGVTTAATLWFSTVMGLCFGGGQIGLGLAALALGVSVLWGLKTFEAHWHKPQQGILTLSLESGDLRQEEINRLIQEHGGKILHWSQFVFEHDGRERNQTCWVTLNEKQEKSEPPLFVEILSRTSGVGRVEWKITGHGS